jgi:glycosyltransferase involved in cell wall biosynthesis
MPRPPVRILHILQSLGYGGMENRIARLARGLDPALYRVEVMSLRPAGTGQVELAPGIRHHFFPIPSGLHPIRLARLALFIRREGYDVVHTHNWSSMFYGILAGNLARFPGKRPLVLHGEHGLNRTDLQGIPWKRLWAQRILSRLVQGIVPVNGIIAAHVASKWRIPHQKLKIINNGVDLERFKPAAPPAGDGLALGMVGRLDDVKDIGCALRALAILKGKDKGGAGDVRLILVGDGPLTANLAAEAARLGVTGSVEFAGGRKDVENWYPRFHVYMNTSVYEGMSNTLLEGMACGLPLIVSRVPGNAAWLKEKENALFFEPGDAEGLAARILELRADPGARAEMGKRNRVKVEREFDNRKFLGIYADFYRNLLTGC